MTERTPTTEVPVTDAQSVIFSLIREVKRDLRENFKSLSNLIMQVNADQRDIAQSVASLETELRDVRMDHGKVQAKLSDVRSIQDSCLARLTFDDTQARLRFHDSTKRRSDTPNGVFSLKVPMKGLSPAVRAILFAVAGALTGIGGVWGIQATVEPSTASQEVVRPKRPVALPSAQLSDDSLDSSERDTASGMSDSVDQIPQLPSTHFQQ